MSEIGDYTGNRWHRMTVMANMRLTNGGAKFALPWLLIGNMISLTLE